MPINIRNPEFEAKVARAAKSNTIRTSKHSLVIAATEAVLVAADVRGVSVGRIMDELHEIAEPSRHKQSA